jgi:uncharacterized protein YidB (DUF937 family)
MTDMISGLLKGMGGGSGGNILQSLMKVADSQGGIGAIVSKLTGSGSPLASKAASWVGTGQNEEAHPQEIEDAVGKDTVAQVAADAGVSHDEAKSGLAALLPQLVDKISPNGKLPDLGSLGSLLGGSGGAGGALGGLGKLLG